MRPANDPATLYVFEARYWSSGPNVDDIILPITRTDQPASQTTCASVGPEIDPAPTDYLPHSAPIIGYWRRSILVPNYSVDSGERISPQMVKFLSWFPVVAAAGESTNIPERAHIQPNGNGPKRSGPLGF